MKASKYFGKIVILKIWELVSLEGAKTHFGKIALKRCIFRHEKKVFGISFDSIKKQIRQEPQKDCLNLSFVKDFGVVSLKMARNGHKIVIYEA